MSIDSFFNSSAFVWLLVLIGVIGFYLKKTGKTLAEFVKDITNFFRELEEEDE